MWEEGARLHGSKLILRRWGLSRNSSSGGKRWQEWSTKYWCWKKLKKFILDHGSVETTKIRKN